MSQTVERAIGIVELLAREPRTLTEVAAHLDVHKSTALRLLQTLERTGFARRGPAGRWTVGLRLIGVAHQALDALDVRAVARPHLERLGRRCGHTVHLGQLVDDEVVYVDKVEGRGQVRMYSRIGLTAAAHASGIGKAILAFLPEPRLTQLLDGVTFRAHTPATVTDPVRFRAELAAVAARGWAVDDGEFEALINCVAAPVRDGTGAVGCAVSVTAPKVVATVTQLREIVPDLLTVADDISRDLGWSGS